MEKDIISQLPDEILQHILSFIDIYEVVQTTILSKRWKDLWRSLLNIRLHLHGYVSYYCFVSHFLSHRDATAPVHSLHLSIDDKFNLTLVEEYVLYAINHGVQSLHLHAPMDLILTLPAALFTSTTVRELEIRVKHTTLDLLERFSLPNFKTLYLGTHLFFNDDQRMEPFAGLTELEKLSLRRFPMNGLVLKAPKLRALEIFESDKIQEIYAPLLTSFRYEGYLPWESNSPVEESMSGKTTTNSPVEESTSGETAGATPTPTPTALTGAEEESAPSDNDQMGRSKEDLEKITTRKLRPRKQLKQPDRYQDFIAK
ncbi:F-box/FBD/LRR-repeat protein At4g26340-like [Salvia hispanica]|uniref:F-box/FBD/LRR-repeat protein At4g26340-like n=1 Tax=Salvia hispanica TaxID=49212 RepID=UPI002008FF11|nr:F-box/FBD/LRR-repeat protein At4g26340-like [Salvia hispanica]